MGARQETQERMPSVQEPERKSKLKIIEKKIIKFTPKFFRIARRVVAVGAIIAIGNYYQTHPDLEKITDENGKTTYVHEDERTTHYLNILAGRDQFTEGDLEAEIKPSILSKLRKKGITLPKNVEKISLNEAYILYYKNTDSAIVELETPEEFNNHNRQLIQMINDQNTLNYSASKDKYSLVWQLEKECGNPRIRFVTEAHLTFVSPKFKDKDKYDPISNTVYINSGSFSDPRKGFVPEMSHAKQFSDNQIGSYLKSIRDLASVTIAGRLNIPQMEEEYDNLYYKTGSLEYEAHEIIEPDLGRKYPLP